MKVKIIDALRAINEKERIANVRLNTRRRKENKERKGLHIKNHKYAPTKSELGYYNRELN